MNITKRHTSGLIFLLCMTYMVSYITRINYGAVISEMENATDLSKSMLSMALTGSFVTYGAGQILSGIAGDIYSPKKLVLYGLMLTTIMNLLIPVCKNPYQMLAVWCVNGLAQAFMWPPIVKLMVAFFCDEVYKRASVTVLYGSSIGTIVVYALSPLLISLFGWKAVFVFSAVCGIIMMFFWQRFCIEVPVVKKQSVKAEKKGNFSFVTPMFVCLLVPIACIGMIRDGVTTWLPSYISETYSLGSVAAIFSGVVLPVFSMLAYSAASALNKKIFKNPISCAAIIMIISAASNALLLFLSGKSAVGSVFFMSLITGCMHGANLMLISYLPPYVSKNGKVSTVSGVINSSVYIGSALSTYGVAYLTEKFSTWNCALVLWFAAALVGGIICFFCRKMVEN